MLIGKKVDRNAKNVAVTMPEDQMSFGQYRPAAKRVERVLFVGQAPGRGGGPGSSLATNRRLAKLLDMSQGEFKSAYYFVNLLDRWPGRAGKGDAFPLDEAREAAARMLEDLATRGGMWLLVLAGRNVARACGLRDADYMRVLGVEPGIRAVIIPHPSGMNRWWNDPRRVERLGKYLRKLLRRTAAR